MALIQLLLLISIHDVLKALNYSINSNSVIIFLLIVNFNLEVPISEGLRHLETTQLICYANW